MRLIALSPALLAAGALAAQNPPRAMRIEPGPYRMSADRPSRKPSSGSPRPARRPAATRSACSSTPFERGSPAEKAGIEEGNRIASINGVSLKLAAADVGDEEMAGVMTRRLTRELDKLKPGDEVDLHVYANGQTKSVKVKTVSSDSLYESMARRTWEDRATLGLQLASHGQPPRHDRRVRDRRRRIRSGGQSRDRRGKPHRVDQQRRRASPRRRRRRNRVPNVERVAIRARSVEAQSRRRRRRCASTTTVSTRTSR